MYQNKKYDKIQLVIPISYTYIKQQSIYDHRKKENNLPLIFVLIFLCSLVSSRIYLSSNLTNKWCGCGSAGASFIFREYLSSGVTLVTNKPGCN